jgi:acyl transferase domain-containing protein
MSSSQELSTTKQALVAIKQLQDKLNDLEQAKSEPIAVIGMGCRLPGGINNPDDFWQFLRDGKDGISEIPPEHWNLASYYDLDLNQTGKICTFYGGFIPHLQTFDAHFFNIAPREAISLDPQQRVLLEVCWEALENSGIPPDNLSGSSTGVFVGICGNDYWHQLLKRDPNEIDAYLITGNTHSTASGRLSYFLGLNGPSLSVNTACSSSLVAIHLAMASLRNQECNLAIVGGVNRIISPEISISFSKARMLSPDGHCKTFDASANGFVRSEGCGVVVLKRLQEAITAQDNILAVLRGSAINQDGRSNGLTAPNGLAQQAVIQQALKNAHIKADDVSYVEAHGTGTILGDSIEIGALGQVFSQKSSGSLIVGSVKANIGHLEAAAGIVSLIKVILCLQNEAIPPQIHFKNPNPNINWSQLPLVIPTKNMSWPRDNHSKVAGVSSFGFSGTNAHVIVSQFPASTPVVSAQEMVKYPAYLFTLSAKSQSARTVLVEKYCDFLTTHPYLSLANVCGTANTSRSDFNYRLAVVTFSLATLQQKLIDFLNEQFTLDLFFGQVSRNHSLKIPFLFCQDVSKSWKKALFLYQTQSVFQKSIDDCKQEILLCLKIDLGNFFEQENQTSSELMLILFILEYALFKLLESWGILPTAVIGCGVGHWVAMTVAEIVSLKDSLMVLAGQKKSDAVTYFPGKVPLLSYLNRHLFFPDPISSQVSNEKALEILNQEDYDLMISIDFQFPDIWSCLCGYLAKFYSLGGSINWSNFEEKNLFSPIILPNYPFQRDAYWYK